jgi:hypothetical protein
LAMMSAKATESDMASVFPNRHSMNPRHSLRRHQALPGEGTVLGQGLKSQGSACFGFAQHGSEVEEDRSAC